MARTFVAASSQSLGYVGAPLTTVPLTLACWFKPASVAGGTNKSLVSLDDGAANEFLLRSVASGGAVAAVANTGISTTAGTQSNGVWGHAAAVFASSTSRTSYLNGVAATVDTTNVTPSGINGTHVGRLWAASQFADGDIAEVAIWNVALSAADMAALALGISPSMIRPDALVFYAPLIGVGSPEPDLVGRRNLTVTGATAAAHTRIQVPSNPYPVNLTALVITYLIAGVTKNSVGIILGSCVVKLYRTSDDVEVQTTTSDASTGAYSFTVLNTSTAYYIVAYKVGSPDVAGTTVNTLVGA